MVGARRLIAQQIARPTFTTPAELVAWMGAVQAQDYLGSKWALGLRLRGATEATIDGALADGSILRTHVFRWTWQLVVPEDVRWMLALVGPRVVARAAGRHRELGLDAAAFAKSERAIEKALRPGRHLTREELAAAIERAGVSPEGVRLSHLLGHAELMGLICSGVPRGKQRTLALLDERAPARGSPRPRDEAIAELARRYARSRGPATIHDFAWWTGLTLTEARAGWAAAGPVEASAPRRSTTTAYLLPAFDEYLVSYKDRRDVLDPEHARKINAGGGMLEAVIVVGGRVVGRWRRTLARAEVVVEIDPLVAVSERAVLAAAERYARFLGLKLRLVSSFLRGERRSP